MKTKLAKCSLNSAFQLMVCVLVSQWTMAQTSTTIDHSRYTYQQVIYVIQSRSDVFIDSKTFADCTPLFDTLVIARRFNLLKHKEDKNLLKKFVFQNYSIPQYTPVYTTDSSDINDHISLLWKVLKRHSDKKDGGSLIPLPYPYIVPGGRFRELYYWDSYFTMLGLKSDHQDEIIRNMIDNFAYLIDKYGFIPNGNRTYYLSRSQPPFFACMISLLVSIYGDSCYKHYLPYMLKEYNYWMEGMEKITEPGSSFQHVVRLSDGSILNRYWDKFSTPRPEAFREDVATRDSALKHHPEQSAWELYRNLRASAESGWDFSSRWIDMEKDSFLLYNIHTIDIIPPDLNSLLFNLEKSIANAFALQNDSIQSQRFLEKCNARKRALVHYCWNEYAGYFMDYDFKKQQQTNVLSLAGVYPLFVNLATSEQATSIAAILNTKFLSTGGVLTSTNNTGQQWDSPNGWAPLQWITITGLRNYQLLDLANEIKYRWLRLNRQVYRNTFKLTEKYNVENDALVGGGGEYPNQDGFGWTNGVYQILSRE